MSYTTYRVTNPVTGKSTLYYKDTAEDRRVAAHIATKQPHPHTATNPVTGRPVKYY